MLQCLKHNLTGIDMTKISITEAAKMAGISRQHLYKHYINTGKISVIKENDKSIIDIAELLRVFPSAKMLTDDNLQNTTDVDTHFTPDNIELVNMLKTQLAESKEREQWLKSQIDELRHQQGHLLENKASKRKKFFGIF